MLRFLYFFAFLPMAAAADWAPRPLMFTYDATFDLCIADADAPDLALTCENALTAAYTLKRAVARAAVVCGDQDLSTCALPFEDEGLPAIAVRIAASAGCEQTDVLDLPEDGQIPEGHCITLASDIMIDEGVVPLSTDISCGIDWIECGEIAKINSTFWSTLITTIGAQDPTINDLHNRNLDDCNAETQTSANWATALDAMTCISQRSSALWADLTQHAQDQ